MRRGCISFLFGETLQGFAPRLGKRSDLFASKNTQRAAAPFGESHVTAISQ